MKVGLSLGSNLGDRLRHLQEAKSFLVGLSTEHWHRAAPVYETQPVDCPPNTPAFYNTVVEIEYAGTPRELLGQLLAYERTRGRDRSLSRNASRPIDIDILYFGDYRIDERDLVIPHPRMMERRFVLLPLAQVRPDLELPDGVGDVRFVQQTW